jgi:hypothetical protein
MRCQGEDMHDDMYPEFAPEPIVVPCRNQATHHWMVAEDAADEGGYPKAGVREVVHVWACAEHAEGVEIEGGWWNQYHPRLLALTVTR